MKIDDSVHKELARATNGEVWELLGEPDRTEAEGRRMLHAAHASQYHWLRVGTAVHEQRGEWLLARVSAELGWGEAALRHATRCAQLTQEHAGDMQDFDVAYAHEALARAHAVLGHQAKAAEWKARARAQGVQIQDPESKKYFAGDLDAGDWHGIE
jgi:hypothetical protein